jgi:hypothetical protein
MLNLSAAPCLCNTMQQDIVPEEMIFEKRFTISQPAFLIKKKKFFFFNQKAYFNEKGRATPPSANHCSCAR